MNKYTANYRGIVVDNTDPDQLGRIKVQIYPMFKDIADPELLPWCVPAMPLFSGAGSGYGYFAIPALNSKVWCFFEGGDIYQPVYFAEAQDRVIGLPAERTTNYPNRKVIKTSSGAMILIDDTDKLIKIQHPDGAYIELDTNNKVNISGDGVEINVDGDVTITST